MNKKYLNDLAKTLAQVTTPEEMTQLLLGLLTLRELESITLRLQIVKLIKSGIPQREIAEKLKVGIATVTRGSKEVQQGRFSDI